MREDIDVKHSQSQQQYQQQYQPFLSCLEKRSKLRVMIWCQHIIIVISQKSLAFLLRVWQPYHTYCTSYLAVARNLSSSRGWCQRLKIRQKFNKFLFCSILLYSIVFYSTSVFYSSLFWSDDSGLPTSIKSKKRNEKKMQRDNF